MFASFDPKISDLNKFIDKAISTTKGQLAIQIWRNAVDFSPVYSGRYRASWSISIGEMAFKFNNSSRQPNSVPAPSRPDLFIAGKAMDKVYVTNGAPYAYFVETGGPKNPAHHVAHRAVSAAI